MPALPSYRRAPARVVLAAVVFVAVLVGVGACSSASDEAAPPSSASAAPTLAPDVAWADSACDVTTSLRGALADLATAIDLVPDSDAAPTVGAPGFAEARGGVQTRLGGVAGVAAGLGALGPPPESSPLEPVADAFAASAARVQPSVLRLKSSAESVTGAQTLAQLAVGVHDMDAPLAATTADVEDLATLLRDRATGKDAAVRRTFADAPSCTRLGG